MWLKCGSNVAQIWNESSVAEIWMIDGDRQEARGAEVQRAVLDLRPRLWRGEEKRKLLKEVQVVRLSF